MTKRVPGMLTALLMGAVAQATDYDVYYVGGQSNMDGYGFTAELAGDHARPVDGVLIFHGNPAADGETGGDGVWAALRPGHGIGFSSSSQGNDYSDRFGPELSLGVRLKALKPDANIAIIKYSRGGTALEEGASGYGTWAPDYAGVNQYDHALATIAAATAVSDIDGDGEPDRLRPAGIVWMQGEADAYHSLRAASRYEANLKRIMDLLRAALRVDDLPVVISRITDSGRDDDGKLMDYIDIVQRAQQQFVATDACAAYSTVTDGQEYPESDNWHYVSSAYVDMGIDYADALVELESACKGQED